MTGMPWCLIVLGWSLGTSDRRRKIERALEEQSLRTSQERKVTRILLSSEHTLQEMEQAGSISAVRCVALFDADKLPFR